MEKHYDVILIYNSGDSKRAEELAKVLSDAGLAVWFDKWNLAPGDSWAAAMAKAMSLSRYVIVLIGASSYGPWVQHEYRPAIHKTIDRDFRLVPVLLPGSRPENVPSMLSVYNFYDLRDWSQDKLEQFALLILRTDRAGAGIDPKPRVFLCHAKEDAKHAEALYQSLKLEGFEPWYDQAKLVVGDNWENEIETAIEDTDFFAILLSKTAARKIGFINREINLAIQQYQRRPHGMAYLLPIRLEKFNVPRIRLTETTTLHELQWIDVFDANTSSIKRLATAIWKQWNKGSQDV
jgi:hypothetical protein